MPVEGKIAFLLLGFDMGTRGALALCICSVCAIGREGVVCEDRSRLVVGEDKTGHVFSGGQNQASAVLRKTSLPARDQSRLPVVAVGRMSLPSCPHQRTDTQSNTPTR